MKSLIAAMLMSLMMVYARPAHVFAQENPQSAPPAESSATGAPAGEPGMMGGKGMMHGKGMMGHGPMAGCSMPECMGPGMGMGMGGMGMMDMKTRAEMMQIRGRAMVEMGNLLIKRGKELEQQKEPAKSPQ